MSRPIRSPSRPSPSPTSRDPRSRRRRPNRSSLPTRTRPRLRRDRPPRATGCRCARLGRGTRGPVVARGGRRCRRRGEDRNAGGLSDLLAGERERADHEHERDDEPAEAQGDHPQGLAVHGSSLRPRWLRGGKGQGAASRRTSTLVPSPCALSMFRVPPHFSTSWRAIARPSPEPPEGTPRPR